MSVDVLTEVTIERPLEEVFAFAISPDNATAWYEKIQRVEWKTEPPFGVGTRIAFAATFLGKRLEYTYEILELVENTRMVMRALEGPFPMETTYEFAAVGEQRTRMTLRNRGRPAGFSRLLAPVMAAAIRRANRADLASLKAVLER